MSETRDLNEAMDAAARVLEPEFGAPTRARQVVEAVYPIIAAQATADLRTRLEALRDEWHKGAQGRFENGRHPGTLGSCADALDALIGGAK